MAIANVCSNPYNQKYAAYIDGCLTVVNGAEVENELCCQKSIQFPVDSSDKVSKFIPARTVVNNVSYPSIVELFDNKLNVIPNLPRLQTRGIQICAKYPSGTDDTYQDLNLFLRITTANNQVFSIPFHNQFTWFGNPVTENNQFLLDKIEVVNDNDFCAEIVYMLLLTANTGAIGDGDCPFQTEIQPVIPTTPIIPLQKPVLLATALTDTTIKLDWSMSYNASFFYIEYSPTGLDNTFVPLTTTTAITYTDTLTPNTTRYYRVKAIGDAERYSDSLFSTIASATTLLAKLVAPVLTVSAINNNSINLSWSTVIGTYYYQIQTSTDNITFADYATVLPNQTNYIHSGLADGTIHYYRVMAVADPLLNQNSDYSNVGSATTLIKLSIPTNFSGTVISDTQIDLSWDAVVGNNGYLIERSEDNVTYTTLTSVAVGSTTYSETTCVTATLYYYKITTLGNNTTTLSSNQSTEMSYTTL